MITHHSFFTLLYDTQYTHSWICHSFFTRGAAGETLFLFSHQIIRTIFFCSAAVVANLWLMCYTNLVVPRVCPSLHFSLWRLIPCGTNVVGTIPRFYNFHERSILCLLEYVGRHIMEASKEDRSLHVIQNTLTIQFPLN